MASSLQTHVEDIIKCTMCLEYMEDSRMLDCQHSFCLKCIAPLAVDGKIECPNCQGKMPVPSGGIDEIPVDFTVNKLAAAFKQNTIHCGSVICATCPMSHGGHLKLEWFCKDCQDFMCEQCADMHKKLPVFDNHELVKSEKCLQHPKKDRSYVCADCQLLICSTCVMVEHQLHQVKDAKKHLATRRHELEKLILQMKDGYSTTIADSVKKVNIKDIEVSVGEKITKIQKEIDQAAKKIILHIEQKQMKLQTSLAFSKSQFESWVGSIKDAKLLITEIGDLSISGGLYTATTTSGEEALNECNRLFSKINKANNDIACNAQVLSSFSSMVIPTDFSAPNADITLGTINTTAEIQAGLDFTMFSKEPPPSHKKPSVGPTQEFTNQTKEMKGGASNPMTDDASAQSSTPEHKVDAPCCKPTKKNAGSAASDNHGGPKSYDRNLLLKMQHHSMSLEKPDDLPCLQDAWKQLDDRATGFEANLGTYYVRYILTGDDHKLYIKQIQKELHDLIVKQKAMNEDVVEWVENNISEQCREPAFIRAMMTAVCRSAIKQRHGSMKVDGAMITSRQALLMKYLDHQLTNEVQALYGLQALVHSLKHPTGLLRGFFDVLYNEDIITEHAFMNWRRSSDPGEKLGKAAAFESVAGFFQFHLLHVT